jgi:hypothetical protein
VLAVLGDFDPPAMRSLLADAFGGWAPAPGQPDAPREAPGGGGGAGAGVGGSSSSNGGEVVWLVDRPGAAQVGRFFGGTAVVLEPIQGCQLPDTSLSPQPRRRTPPQPPPGKRRYR